MPFFICESCYLVFTTTIRRPMALPCGHTYCFRCVRNQYTTNNNVKCPKCSKKHYLHYDHYSTNYSIMEKIHSNNTIYLNNSNGKDSFGYQTFRIESFSIIKGEMTRNAKQLIQKPSYPSLFNYFEVMKRIVNYPQDSNSWLRKFFKIVYIPLIIFLLIMLNYVCLTQMRFSEVFVLVCILYESAEETEEILKVTKLWMGFVTLLLVDNLIDYLWIATWSFGMNVCICLRTLYVILLLGNDNTLNTVVVHILNVLNEANLLVR